MILKIDGTKVGRPHGDGRALRAGGPKKVVTVLRNGKEVELKLELGAARGGEEPSSDQEVTIAFGSQTLTRHCAISVETLGLRGCLGISSSHVRDASACR